jgi:dihydrolipoamide dehydrogenase
LPIGALNSIKRYLACVLTGVPNTGTVEHTTALLPEDPDRFLGRRAMNERCYDVVVIGVGTAGLKSYKAATARNADVAIVERGSGGSTCTRVGCMPSKLLIAAARMAHNARRAHDFGITVGDISVNPARLWARVRAERDRFVASVLEEYHAIPKDHVIHGTARFAGPDTIIVGDDRISAKRGIIIATGARPIIPSLLDPVRELVHTHETIFELNDLPVAMAVIGAGPLGLELAQAFARLGVEVTVLDEGNSIGGLKDPATNSVAIDALGDEMSIKLGVSVEASLTEDNRARLAWSDGEVVVDLVLAATGRPPAIQGLNLDATRLALDDHGMPLFDRSTHRCGDSNIFIVGDADAWRPVLHEAARAGGIAGDVAMGGTPPKMLPAFAVAFTEPNLSEVGVSFDSLPKDARIGEAEVRDNGRAVAGGETQGLVRLYADANGKLIGASIVAPDGEHLGHLASLAIDRGMNVAELADQRWYHPTIEELLQSAARDMLKEDE